MEWLVKPLELWNRRDARSKLRFVRFTRPSVGAILLGIALLIVFLPVFWLAGGIRWLEVKVFPPIRPRIMPVNSVWIDAPSLPISWHRGWWFGCGLSNSGTANYCRLVQANGELVYGDEYLPCGTHSVTAEASIRLVPPPDDASMWLFEEGNNGVIGFLVNGDLLLPVVAQDKCTRVKARLNRHSSP
jgi:hypothetical protein